MNMIQLGFAWLFIWYFGKIRFEGELQVIHLLMFDNTWYGFSSEKVKNMPQITDTWFWKPSSVQCKMWDVQFDLEFRVEISNEKNVASTTFLRWWTHQKFAQWTFLRFIFQTSEWRGFFDPSIYAFSNGQHSFNAYARNMVVIVRLHAYDS